MERIEKIYIMEKELNVAAILKEKPKYTKLYSPLYGEVFLNRLTSDDGIRILCKGLDGSFCTGEKSFWKNGKFTLAGEICLFPSKQMRDWSKFTWKKGDVLFCGVDNFCIFDKWANKDYTEFYGRFSSQNYSKGYDKLDTECWAKVGSDGTKLAFIKRIEKFHNGKLNLETLQIDKQPKQEFKDGDIVTLEGSGSYAKCVIIFKNNNPQVISNDIHYHALLNVERMKMGFDNCVYNRENNRLATDSEKQQLFDALAKEGKVWNSETKQVEDLPKKCELKPFDKVLVRDTDAGIWMPTLFGFYDEEFKNYVCLNDVFQKCIPYNDSTKHLLGTTDEWKGGEG